MFKHGFPPEWSTLKKLIWLVGSGIAGGAKGIWKTVTGTLIHITDALASPMQKCEVTLEPIQDLHGQDAPYPAGGGKNKFDVGTSTSDYTDNGVIIKSVSGSTLTLEIKDNAATFTYRTQQLTITGDIRISFTASKRGSRAFIQLRKLDDSGWMTSSDVSLPNMTYNSIFGGWYQNQDPNTNYSLTTTIPECLYWRFGIGYNNNFVTAGNRETIKDIQIELGSQAATPYSPYSNICPITGWTGCEVWVKDEYDASLPSTASVTFPDGQTVYGGKYEFVGGNGSNDRAKIVLDGSQEELSGVNWRANDDSVGFYYNFTGLDFPSGLNAVANAISDTLKATSYELIYSSHDYEFALIEVSGYSRLCVRVKDMSLTTKSAINAYLAENPITIVYQRSEAVPFTGTPQPINTLVGENNIWTDVNGDITLIYKAQAE